RQHCTIRMRGADHYFCFDKSVERFLAFQSAPLHYSPLSVFCIIEVLARKCLRAPILAYMNHAIVLNCILRILNTSKCICEWNYDESNEEKSDWIHHDMLYGMLSKAKVQGKAQTFMARFRSEVEEYYAEDNVNEE
ncbi:hypothetical protein PMAYCL1PPCAC_04669, partial [Pristionchus mayeri]